MSNTQHTPGPWAYSTSQEGWSYTVNIFQADNAAPTDGWSDVAYIIKTCAGEQQAIQEANARLIAAAPELLEALREACKQARHPDYDWPLDLQREVDAAIAKATGGAV